MLGPGMLFVTTFRSHGLINELSHRQHKVLKTFSNVAKQLWITISFENNASVAIETFSRGRRTSAPVLVKKQTVRLFNNEMCSL